METIAQRLSITQARIRQAAWESGRKEKEIHLLAVSKTQSVAALQAAIAAGQRQFGESYVQEALVKMAALAEPDLVWHYIGPIQANKCRDIAEHFSWVHSVDRLKTAERLSHLRPAHLPALQICLQVNISNEPSKSGASVEELLPLAIELAKLPNLQLRGLMAIPAPADDPTTQRLPFSRLRQALETLNRTGLALDTLSMGMSDDLEVAIAEGSTLVRIGTAIFGPRQ